MNHASLAPTSNRLRVTPMALNQHCLLLSSRLLGSCLADAYLRTINLTTSTLGLLRISILRLSCCCSKLLFSLLRSSSSK
jgi:hypothetical protein